MSEKEEGSETMSDSHPSDATELEKSEDPFSPSKIRQAALQLESLRKTSLTIYNLSTPVSPLPGQASQDSVDDENEKERRYDLAHAIAKYAYESRLPLATKTCIYHLAFLEYYKLLQTDFYYGGVLESVLFLLAILGYDEHCLGLMDFVFQSLENEETITTLDNNQQNKDECLASFYDILSNNKVSSMESKVELLNSHEWSANAFLVPLLLIALRKISNGSDGKDPVLPQSITYFTETIQQHSLDKEFTLWQSLLSNTTDIESEQASSVLAHKTRQDHRWEESCLLFWNILKDCIQQDNGIRQALEDTIYFMERKSLQPPTTPKKITSLHDLLDSSNPQVGNLYCLHCRQPLTTPNALQSRGRPSAMRCSRCCAVHYCSRTCQKKNYALLHKERCKNIFSLKSSSSSLQSKYDLAYAIVDLAYVSTDTIDRGRKIYHLALVEYCKLLEDDFHYVGALESTLILLSILGYDTILVGIIDFVLYHLEQHPDDNIAICNFENEVPILLLELIAGGESPEQQNIRDHLGRLSVLKGSQWSSNNFLLPLLFWALKEQSRQRTEEQWKECMHTSATIALAIEQQSPNLPVLRGLLPDSIQRWGHDEAKEILATPNNAKESKEHWEESCLLFLEILKDAIAFTPKVADALEETIEAMEQLVGVSPMQEVPHDLSDYGTWSGEMAKEIR